MIGLIDKLAYAIARQEGFFSTGTRQLLNHNPGDLRGAPWLFHPKFDGGYWRADSDAEGIAGLYHQIALDIARGMTLRQLVASWAPTADGNATALLSLKCAALDRHPGPERSAMESA